MVYCGTSANKSVCPDPVWKPVIHFRDLQCNPLPLSTPLFRHRLNGYLAEWVSSPPGERTFKNLPNEAHPKTACKNKTRSPVGKYPFSRCRLLVVGGSAGGRRAPRAAEAEGSIGPPPHPRRKRPPPSRAEARADDAGKSNNTAQTTLWWMLYGHFVGIGY